VTDDKLRAALDALNDPQTPPEHWRHVMTIVIGGMFDELRGAREDITAIRDLTPTREQIDAVAKAMEEDKFWAGVGQRLAKYGKTILAGAGMVIAIWGVVEVVAKIKAMVMGDRL